MKWIVKGAKRDTGADVAIEVDADNQESAERRAGRQGIIVESCVPVFTIGDNVEELAAAALAEDPSPTAPANVPPPSSINYATPPAAPAPAPSAYRPSLVAPDYTQILTGARVLNGYALVLFVIAFLSICVGILMICRAIVSDGMESYEDKAAAASSLAAGVGLLLVGALIRMISSLAHAVRDIARNSFR